MSRKRYIHLGLATLVFTLAGCASDRVWYNPNKSAAEADHDMRECRYEAEKYSTGAGAGYQTGVGEGLAIGLKQRELMKQCMELKGYRLVPTSELPPGSTVTRPR